MALISLPNSSVVRVQVWSTLAGQAVINHFDYRIVSVPAAGTDYKEYMDTLANALNAPGGLIPTMRNVMPFDQTINLLRLQPIHPQRLRFYDYPVDLIGLHIENAATANVAASIERWSRSGGRKGIGRISIPVPRAVYEAGILNEAGYLIALDLLATKMKESVTSSNPSATYEPVIMNPWDPNSVPRQVEGSVAKRTVRVQRRRTVGLGI